MLAQLVAQDVFSFLLIFARVGAAMIAMPAIGESAVPTRYRLLLGVALAILVAPALAGRLPALPSSPVALLLLLGIEIAVGAFLGLVGRIMMSALYTAGTIISFQASLSNAFMFDPTAAQQGSLPSLFLGTLGVLLLMVTDLHHVMLRAVFDSYGLITPGVMPPIGDLSESVTRLVAEAFLLGVQLSAPLIVVGLVLYLGVGLLARLMPQMQVFFIMLPVQIALGLAILAITLPAMMLWFLNDFRDAFGRALGAT